MNTLNTVSTAIGHVAIDVAQPHPHTRKDAVAAFEAALIALYGLSGMAPVRTWPTKYQKYVTRWKGYYKDQRVNRGEILVTHKDKGDLWVRVTDPLYAKRVTITRLFLHQDALGEVLRKAGWTATRIDRALDIAQSVEELAVQFLIHWTFLGGDTILMHYTREGEGWSIRLDEFGRPLFVHRWGTPYDQHTHRVRLRDESELVSHLIEATLQSHGKWL